MPTPIKVQPSKTSQQVATIPPLSLFELGAGEASEDGAPLPPGVARAPDKWASSGAAYRWDPQAQYESLEGVVVSWNQAQYGKAYIIKAIIHDVPQRVLVFASSVMQNEIDRAGVSPGDTVAIQYMGKKPTDKGNDMKLFRVFRFGKPAEGDIPF